MVGRTYNALGEYGRAKDYHERALAIRKKISGELHPDVATSLNNLGATYFQMGQKDKARQYLEKAYALFKQFYGDEHPSTKTVKEWLEGCRN
ncbi:MAG: tetratricopeptide repeat protein [Candidatus Aminicenantes bacterium]|nr:tetratricopeptide repeat protein [Candidatus Aminicenantes bacterium]